VLTGKALYYIWTCVSWWCCNFNAVLRSTMDLFLRYHVWDISTCNCKVTKL